MSGSSWTHTQIAKAENYKLAASSHLAELMTIRPGKRGSEDLGDTARELTTGMAAAAAAAFAKQCIVSAQQCEFRRVSLVQFGQRLERFVCVD